MIIFYDKDGNIRGTIDSPFEDGFEMDGCEKLKTSTIETKDIHYHKIKDGTIKFTPKKEIKKLKDKIKDKI